MHNSGVLCLLPRAIRPYSVALALLLVLAPPLSASARSPLIDHLRANGQRPDDYVLSRLQTHRVVLLGEHHWIRHDVELVLSLIPRLREVGVYTLAVEILDAEKQDEVDRLVQATEWMPELAMSLQRAQAWPYQEYLDILRAVWEVNRWRPEGERALTLVALGPGSNWRERLLPLGKTYDSFMAERVLERSRGEGAVLVYGGLNHVFTRFYQPERPREDRVEAFMDRMGNILWRSLGEDVFTIVLHRPLPCRREGGWTHCLPVAGAVDCAAAALGNPVGFDVVDSPFAELRLDPDVLYSLGYPAPRLVDFTDGYIWFKPIDAYEGVTLIPLTDYAPDAASLEEVTRRSPFSNQERSTRGELVAQWAKELESLGDFPKRFRWSIAGTWREACEDRGP